MPSYRCQPLNYLGRIIVLAGAIYRQINEIMLGRVNHHRGVVSRWRPRGEILGNE